MYINKVHCNNSVQLKLGYQVDAIVTDPPYGINYDKWDKYEDCVSFNKNTWKNISENLKPGGYLAIFGAARTFHRLVCAVEDAGLDIRDQLLWLHSMGMPKSSNIGKKLPEWEGWGTGLKPCYEPILLAQKKCVEKTIVKNVEKHGVGAINIYASRTPEGRHLDVMGVDLVENKILGSRETHRIVISTHEEVAPMGKPKLIL